MPRGAPVNPYLEETAIRYELPVRVSTTRGTLVIRVFQWTHDDEQEPRVEVSIRGQAVELIRRMRQK